MIFQTMSALLLMQGDWNEKDFCQPSGFASLCD